MSPLSIAGGTVKTSVTSFECNVACKVVPHFKLTLFSLCTSKHYPQQYVRVCPEMESKVIGPFSAGTIPYR